MFDATFYGNFGPKNSAFVWVGSVMTHDGV